jgi:hypothetical protein
VEYDEGSVLECIRRYKDAESCTDLQSLIETCEVEPFPGTVSTNCSE